MRTTTLTFKVDYDETETSPESVMEYLDNLLMLALWEERPPVKGDGIGDIRVWLMAIAEGK